MTCSGAQVKMEMATKDFIVRYTSREPPGHNKGGKMVVVGAVSNCISIFQTKLS